MRVTADLGRCLVGMAVSLHVLGLAGAAAGEPIRAGTVALTLAGGYSLSHNELAGNVDTLKGYHAIPHIGYFLAENFELLVEPTFLYLEGREAARLGGLSLLARLVSGGSGMRVYVEAGGGGLEGRLQLRNGSCDAAFTVQGGIGLLFFVSERAAVSAGYRFHHLSNGNLCSGNPGLDSSMAVLGLSYFFP